MSQDNFIKKLLNIKEKNLEITNIIEENIKGSMSFVYCNAETSEIIDIVEDRRLQSLKEYFSRFPKEVRNKVKHVVIDMYKPYISLLQEMFPKAKISIDKFHLVQLINRSFNKLRISLFKKPIPKN